MTDSMNRWLRTSGLAGWLLTVLRLGLGYFWFSAGLAKVLSPEWNAGRIAGFVEHSFSSPGAAWYDTFLRDVVLPNATLFSQLVSWGELLAGAALLLGCLTPLAVIAGIFMNMNYLLAGTVSINPEMIIGEMIILAAGYNAAKVGLDYWVHRLFMKAEKKEVVKQEVHRASA